MLYGLLFVVSSRLLASRSLDEDSIELSEDEHEPPPYGGRRESNARRDSRASKSSHVSLSSSEVPPPYTPRSGPKEEDSGSEGPAEVPKRKDAHKSSHGQDKERPPAYAAQGLPGASLRASSLLRVALALAIFLSFSLSATLFLSFSLYLSI